MNRNRMNQKDQNLNLQCIDEMVDPVLGEKIRNDSEMKRFRNVRIVWFIHL